MTREFNQVAIEMALVKLAREAYPELALDGMLRQATSFFKDKLGFTGEAVIAYPGEEVRLVSDRSTIAVITRSGTITRSGATQGQANPAGYLPVWAKWCGPEVGATNRRANACEVRRGDEWLPIKEVDYS